MRDWRSLPVDEVSKSGWAPVCEWGLAWLRVGGFLPLPGPWDPWWSAPLAPPSALHALPLLPPAAPPPPGDSGAAADFSGAIVSFAFTRVVFSLFYDG
eukprot:5574380-Prymnesium_polylepis.1